MEQLNQVQNLETKYCIKGFVKLFVLLFYTFDIIIIIVTCHELYSRLKTILDISLNDSLHPKFLHFSSDFMEIKMYTLLNT